MSIHRLKDSGRYRFEFDARIGGKRVRATKLLPQAWDRARADAFDRKESARLYAVASGTEAPANTIDEAVALYLDHRLPKLGHGKSTARDLALIAPFYVGRPMSELAEVCREIQMQSAKKDGSALSAATIKKRIAYLRSACRYAWKEHFKTGSDPAQRVTTPSVDNARHEYLTREEMLRLANLCRPDVRAMVRIAFYSGMRFSEITRAQVQDGCFILRTSKNKDPRVIPIHPRLNCLLHMPRTNYWVTNYHFVKARKKAGLEHKTFHDLRHSAATEMASKGATLLTIGAVLGHRSGVSTRRYAHVVTEAQKAAINLIGRRKA